MQKVLEIRDILVRIRIRGSIPLALTNGSEFGSGSPTPFFGDLMDTNVFSSYLLLIKLSAGTLSLALKISFLLKFCVKILFCKHYFSPLNTFMRKGKDPDPESDLWLTDPDPGGPKHWMQIYCSVGNVCTYSTTNVWRGQSKYIIYILACWLFVCVVVQCKKVTIELR